MQPLHPHHPQSPAVSPAPPLPRRPQPSVRLGLVGYGKVGSSHGEAILAMPGVKLAAVCENDSAAAGAVAEMLHIPVYSEVAALLPDVEAVLIATPHKHHAPAAIAALRAGRHVLCEKPLAADVAGARQMVDVWHQARNRHPDLQFGVMFQQRLMPAYAELRRIVTAGRLGEMTRLTWTVTDWFRTHAYYRSGGWRGTWAGEGGGVLMNQAPHNLDLLLWLATQRPARVTAVAACGKGQPVEVETEVSALIDFDGGAVGHFITATAEAPGVNRLEWVGTRGTAILEDGHLSLRLLDRDVREWAETGPAKLRAVPYETIVPDLAPPLASDPTEQKPYRQAVIRNFIDAVNGHATLVAPAAEAVGSVELANAMIMSGLTRRPVDLPLDESAYATFMGGLHGR